MVYRNFNSVSDNFKIQHPTFRSEAVRQSVFRVAKNGKTDFHQPALISPKTFHMSSSNFKVLKIYFAPKFSISRVKRFDDKYTYFAITLYYL